MYTIYLESLHLDYHRRQTLTAKYQSLENWYVGVDNGYDEVNVQIPEEENVETFFDKYFSK